MNRKYLFITLFLCLAASLSAFGLKEKDGGKAQVVRITGDVRLVGPGLFPEIVITGSENEWYVDKDEMSKLYDLQRRTVTVEGEETVVELRFAGGLPAGVRRTLKNIKIISIE